MSDKKDNNIIDLSVYRAEKKAKENKSIFRSILAEPEPKEDNKVKNDKERAKTAKYASRYNMDMALRKYGSSVGNVNKDRFKNKDKRLFEEEV
jgi:hypothetical protein